MNINKLETNTQRIERLEAENAELRKDKERLDWLEADCNDSIRAYATASHHQQERDWHFKRKDGFLSKDHENNLRSVIDSAMGAK